MMGHAYARTAPVAASTLVLHLPATRLLQRAMLTTTSAPPRPKPACTTTPARGVYVSFALMQSGFGLNTISWFEPNCCPNPSWLARPAASRWRNSVSSCSESSDTVLTATPARTGLSTGWISTKNDLRRGVTCCAALESVSDTISGRKTLM